MTATRMLLPKFNHETYGRYWSAGQRNLPEIIKSQRLLEQLFAQVLESREGLKFETINAFLSHSYSCLIKIPFPSSMLNFFSQLSRSTFSEKLKSSVGFVALLNALHKKIIKEGSESDHSIINSIFRATDIKNTKPLVNERRAYNLLKFDHENFCQVAAKEVSENIEIILRDRDIATRLFDQVFSHKDLSNPQYDLHVLESFVLDNFFALSQDCPLDLLIHFYVTLIEKIDPGLLSHSIIFNRLLLNVIGRAVVEDNEECISQLEIVVKFIYETRQPGVVTESVDYPAVSIENVVPEGSVKKIELKEFKNEGGEKKEVITYKNIVMVPQCAQDARQQKSVESLSLSVAKYEGGIREEIIKPLCAGISNNSPKKIFVHWLRFLFKFEEFKLEDFVEFFVAANGQLLHSADYWKDFLSLNMWSDNLRLSIDFLIDKKIQQDISLKTTGQKEPEFDGVKLQSSVKFMDMAALPVLIFLSTKKLTLGIMQNISANTYNFSKAWKRCSDFFCGLVRVIDDDRGGRDSDYNQRLADYIHIEYSSPVMLIFYSNFHRLFAWNFEKRIFSIFFEEKCKGLVGSFFEILKLFFLWSASINNYNVCFSIYFLFIEASIKKSRGVNYFDFSSLSSYFYSDLNNWKEFLELYVKLSDAEISQKSEKKFENYFFSALHFTVSKRLKISSDVNYLCLLFLRNLSFKNLWAPLEYYVDGSHNKIGNAGPRLNFLLRNCSMLLWPSLLTSEAVLEHVYRNDSSLYPISCADRVNKLDVVWFLLLNSYMQMIKAPDNYRSNPMCRIFARVFAKFEREEVRQLTAERIHASITNEIFWSVRDLSVKLYNPTTLLDFSSVQGSEISYLESQLNSLIAQGIGLVYSCLQEGRLLIFPVLKSLYMNQCMLVMLLLDNTVRRDVQSSGALDEFDPAKVVFGGDHDLYKSKGSMTNYAGMFSAFVRQSAIEGKKRQEMFKGSVSSAPKRNTSSLANAAVILHG